MKPHVKIKPLWLSALALSLLTTCGSTTLARAQAAQAQTATVNPAPAVAPVTPSPAAASSTPEQQQQQHVHALTLYMQGAGFDDKELQATLLAYAQEQETALLPLRQAGRKLIQAMREQDVSSAALATLFNDFRTAAEEYKTTHQAAQGALNAKIHYTQQPRLQAYLTLWGLIGDEVGLLASVPDAAE